jgi:hypothetical protein
MAGQADGSRIRAHFRLSGMSPLARGAKKSTVSAEISGAQMVTEIRRKPRHSSCVIDGGSEQMIDREKLEAILANRFRGAQRDQIAAAANAIVALIREDNEACADVGSRRKKPSPPASPLPSSSS